MSNKDANCNQRKRSTSPFSSVFDIQFLNALLFGLGNTPTDALQRFVCVCVINKYQKLIKYTFCEITI